MMVGLDLINVQITLPPHLANRAAGPFTSIDRAPTGPVVTGAARHL
jgi:hypothetical protein